MQSILYRPSTFLLIPLEMSLTHRPPFTWQNCRFIGRDQLNSHQNRHIISNDDVIFFYFGTRWQLFTNASHVALFIHEAICYHSHAAIVWNFNYLLLNKRIMCLSNYCQSFRNQMHKWALKHIKYGKNSSNGRRVFCETCNCLDELKRAAISDEYYVNAMIS